MTLAILEIGMGPQVKERIGSKVFDILAVMIELPELQGIESGRIDVLVGAAQFGVTRKNLMKGLPEHAATTCDVDPLHIASTGLDSGKVQCRDDQKTRPSVPNPPARRTLATAALQVCLCRVCVFRRSSSYRAIMRSR